MKADTLVLRGDDSNHLGFPGGSDGKESTCNAGDLGLIPGLGRSPGGGNGNALQYSCLENPMDRGAWRGIVHGSRRVGHDWATKHMPPVYTRATQRKWGTPFNVQGHNLKYYLQIKTIVESPWGRGSQFWQVITQNTVKKGMIVCRFKSGLPTPVFLPGESQGWGSLVGCRLWGRTESDTTEAT